MWLYIDRKSALIPVKSPMVIPKISLMKKVLVRLTRNPSHKNLPHGGLIMSKEPKYTTGTTGVKENPKAAKSVSKKEHTIEPPKVSTQHY